MKTPMQEFIEYLNEEHQLIKRLGGLNQRELIEDVIKKAESMLEKEKDVILDAWLDDRFPLDKEWAKQCAEAYYNETFNVK